MVARASKVTGECGQTLQPFAPSRSDKSGITIPRPTSREKPYDKALRNHSAGRHAWRTWGAATRSGGSAGVRSLCHGCLSRITRPG
jgi:hypothetical protein